MKLAMITVEILISILIITLVIATSVSSVKFFNILNNKKISYENRYITISSIKDKLSKTLCRDFMQNEGNINNFHYIAKCTLYKKLHVYQKETEFDNRSGNIGNNIAELYKVNLNIKKNALSTSYQYYLLQSNH